MKKVIVWNLLLYCCLFSQGTTAQPPTYYEYELITEAEVRDFMQQVLWFSNYGRNSEANPDERFLYFLSDSLQQVLREQDFVWYNYSLHGALIHRVDPPWVEILTTKGADTRNWQQVMRFRIDKKKGKLHLVPRVNKTWNNTYVTAWQATSDFPLRPATAEEKTAIRDDVVAYLDHRFPAAEPASWTREQLLGYWRIDSTYYFVNGEKFASIRHSP